MGKRYCHPEAHNLSGRSFGLAIVDRLSELSLRKARPIEWHSHEETEIICCIKGSLKYEFRNRLGATLTTGCFLVIPGNLAHRLADGIDGPCRRISFFLPNKPTGKSRTSPFTQGEYRDILSDVLKKRFRPRAFAPSLQRDLTRIANLVQRGDLSARECVDLRITTAAALVSLAATKTCEHARPNVRLIGEAVQWLHEHFHEKISLDQMAAFMGYSPSRFCILFKEHTGLPPVEWLIRYRIERACALLKAEKDAISTIARKVGFDDPLFFSRIFRKRIGLSPTEYQIKSLPRAPNACRRAGRTGNGDNNR